MLFYSKAYNYYFCMKQALQKEDATSAVQCAERRNAEMYKFFQIIKYVPATVGDGNEVNVRYRGAATALANLKEALLKSNLEEVSKLNVVADIDTIQSQLAKAQPNKTVIREVWEGIAQVAVAAGLGADVYTLGNSLPRF
jgi:hypothetical protein